MILHFIFQSLRTVIKLKHINLKESVCSKSILVIYLGNWEVILYKNTIASDIILEIYCLEKTESRNACHRKKRNCILFGELNTISSTKAKLNCEDIIHGKRMGVLNRNCNSGLMNIINLCSKHGKGVQTKRHYTTEVILDLPKIYSDVPLSSQYVFCCTGCCCLVLVSWLNSSMLLFTIIHSHIVIFNLSLLYTTKRTYCRVPRHAYPKIALHSSVFLLLFSILSMEAFKILIHIIHKLFAEISVKRLLMSYCSKHHLKNINKDKDKMSLNSFLKQNIKPLKPRQIFTVFPIYGKTLNAATIRRQQDDSLLLERRLENGEIVNASARGQNESNTLITGGRMESELLRLSTLCKFPVFGISLLRLSEYGFYSEGNNDELVCYSCGNRVKGWTPKSDHSDVNNHYSNCQHIRKKKFVVPLDASGCSEEFTQMGKPNGNTEQLCDEKISSDLSIMCTDDGHDAITANFIVSSDNNEEQHNNQSRTIGQAIPTETSSNANGNEVYPYISEMYGLSRGIDYSENVVRREFGVSNNQYSESPGTGTHESIMNRSQTFPAPYTREISVDGNTTITDSLNLLSLESEEQMPYLSAITQNPRNNLPSVSHEPMITQNGSLKSNQEQLTFKYDGRLLKIKYPNYEPLQKRRDSYYDWPANRDFLHPYDLAECGFFFTHFEDCVRCFQCGIGLRNWEDNDNVWVEHARWSQKCQYLTLRKGKEFIDTVVQMLGLNTDGENMQTEPLQLEPTDITQSTRNPLEHTAAQYVLSEKIFDDVELVRVCMLSLIETKGWNSITPNLLVDSILEMSALEEATSIDNKATNSQSHGYKPCMDCPVETGNQTSHGTEIKSSTTESIKTVVEIDKTKKAEDDPEELQKEIEKMKDLYTCKICLDEKVGVTFLPCGHLVTCAQCSPKLRRCPLCRTFIRSTIQTKI